MAVNSVAVVSNNGTTGSVADDGSGNLTITLGLGNVAPTGDTVGSTGKKLVVGNNSSVSAGVTGASQTIGIGGVYHSIMNWNGSQAGLAFTNSGGSTPGSHGAISSSAELGQTDYFGDDGTNYTRGASVRVLVDGTISTGIVPTKIDTYTMSTAGSLIKALTVDSSQNVTIQTGDLLVGSSTTGGHKGAGTLNASALYQGGVAIGSAAFATAPTGYIVGTTDTQILTNKTFDTCLLSSANNSATSAQFDASASPAYTTLANGAHTPITPAGATTAFLILIQETLRTGAFTSYLCNGGGAVWNGTQTNGTSWVACTTTPAAGKLSVAWDAGNSCYSVYNNLGNTCTFKVTLIRNS